jgi:RNA polymerase sigma-70 factor (ECF subfamily)
VTFHDPAWLEQERRLLRELRRGDRAAFSQLYRAFAQPLYARVLVPKLGDADAAQDALAETFRIMLEKLNQYEDRGGSIWSWLATVAANQARDVARARERAGRALRNFETQWAPLLEPMTTMTTASPGGEPGDLLKLQASVSEALRAINPRYSRALTLRFLEDRPRADCAALLDVKLGTFDVLLLRAVRAFRAQWQQAHAGDSQPRAQVSG